MSSSLFNALSSNTLGTNMLMQTIQRNNPQAFSQLQTLLASGNQDKVINQMLSQATPQQVGQLKMMAKQFGVSDADLNKYIK